MPEANAFIIKLKINEEDEIYKLYVPDDFIMGDFHAVENKLRLKGEIFYSDYASDLRRYEKKMKEGRAEITRRLYLPEDILNKIKSGASRCDRARRKYSRASRTLVEALSSIDQHA